MILYVYRAKVSKVLPQERNDPARYEEGKQKNQDMDRIMNDNLTQHERYLYGSENRGTG